MPTVTKISGDLKIVTDLIVCLYSFFFLKSRVVCRNQYKGYHWIAHQMHIGTTLEVLLSRSNFKSETNFGSLFSQDTECKANFQSTHTGDNRS